MSEQQSAPTPILVDSLQQSVSKEAAPLLNFVLRNIKAIAVGLVVLVGLISGAGIYNYMQEKNIADAQATLAELSGGASTESQINALKAFADEAPAKVRPAALLALANASLRVRDYPVAIEAWKALRNENIGSMNDMAAMGISDALARSGDFKGAQAELESALPTVSKAYELTLKHQLALMAEKSGDLARALALNNELAESVPAANKAFYTHKIALLKNKLGK